MQYRALIAFLSTAALLAACESPSAPPSAPALAMGNQSRAPEKILYRFSASATQQQLHDFERVAVGHGLAPEAALVDGEVHLASAQPRGGRSSQQVIDELLATGALEYAEVDALLAPDAMPSDTLLYRQWHHRVMHSFEAWDITTGSADVKAVICDGGIELTHPDLAANISGPGYNVVDNTPDGSHVTSHGTKVAGMLGAVGNNVEGVAGINWRVSIVSVRITNRADGLAAISDMVKCVDYARMNGARVVNVSYGGIRSSSAANSAGLALQAAGGLLFVSAGNDKTLEKKIPNYAGIIVVAGTDSLDGRYANSNSGPMVDIAAPAARVTTTQLTTNTVQGPYVRGENGTSFASPLVAGTAALIWSIRPDLSPAAVQDVLFRSAADLGSAGHDVVYGNGRLDVGAAITRALTATEPPPPPPPPPGRGRGK